MSHIRTAIILPSRNEGDSIGNVTALVDQGLLARGIEGSSLIINTDNSDDECTQAAFMTSPTQTEKISVATGGIGKGDNILRGLELAVAEGAGQICMFDSDLVSFRPEWVGAYLDQLEAGAHLVAPRYARYWIEGATTNHLCVPVLRALLGRSVAQPIAGDFGLSAALAQSLGEEDPSIEQRKYGIDVLITGTALLGGLAVAEVPLGQKLHKPSFDKTIPTFLGAATSLFDLIGRARPAVPLGEVYPADDQSLLDAAPVSPVKLQQRHDEAMTMLRNLQTVTGDTPAMSDEIWVDALAQHVSRAYGGERGEVIAASLLPYFLLRTVAFLSESKTGEEASAALLGLPEMLRKRLLLGRS